MSLSLGAVATSHLLRKFGSMTAKPILRSILGRRGSEKNVCVYIMKMTTMNAQVQKLFCSRTKIVKMTVISFMTGKDRS